MSKLIDFLREYEALMNKYGMVICEDSANGDTIISHSVRSMSESSKKDRLYFAELPCHCCALLYGASSPDELPDNDGEIVWQPVTRDN